MFKDFAHRHIPCTVNGVADKVILSRETKATTVIGKESTYNGLFAPTSAVQNGSLVEATDSFLVQALRLTVEKDKYCSLIKTNDLITVQRYSRQYDSKDNPTGITFAPIASNVKAFSEYVTAKLRQEEPGLLPTTVYVLQLQTSVDVRDPQDTSLVSPDRIILNGRPYRVDAVDKVKYPNLLHIQLSEDLR